MAKEIPEVYCPVCGRTVQVRTNVIASRTPEEAVPDVEIYHCEYCDKDYAADEVVTAAIRNASNKS